jgi:hypothetical protein
MGQTQSASIPSAEQILEKTKGGKDLANELFLWMVKQTSIRDFYLMANPEQCKKYIMLTADVLNKVFYKINVNPESGPGGMIYFRKLNVLNPQSKEDPLYKHREVNCLRLAFLYVRIFQVFAALSLTVLDVDTKMELDLIRDVNRIRDIEMVPLFGSRQEQQKSRGFFTGGALDSRKRLPIVFEPLRPYLSEIPTNPSYYKISGTSIYIEYNSQMPDGSLPVKYDVMSSSTNGKKERRLIEGRMLVERRGSEGIQVQLFNCKLTVGNSRKELEDTNVNFSRQSIEGDFKDRGGRSIPEGLDNVFRKLATGETVDKDKDKDVQDGTARGRNKGSITQFEKDMGEVSEGLHTKTIISAFTRSMPPKAHCIARALQLVSEAGVKSAVPDKIYSYICQTKFMIDTKSLPPAGDRITKEDGIYALAQLFYDTLKVSTPAISQATQEQYKAFLEKMKFVFEESKSTLSADNLKKNPLATIVNKVPSALCGKETTDRTFTITNQNLIKAVRNNVRQMIQYQLGHTANVVKVLKKLFLLPVESGKPLQIHPRVLKYGMAEVNTIAEEARELLVEYYSQCEILYRSGAEILAANKSLLKTI